MRKKITKITDVRVKKKIIGLKQFFISYAVMLLLVGFQMGILVLPAFHTLSEFFKINIIMLYWAIVALVFCILTNWQLKQGYDRPMRKLSSAAEKVAHGDFSVYVEPMHTPDNYDYIDVMLLDFNTMVQELGSIETLKNDFISNVSHEIKTPLSVIKNYTSALRNENLSSETKKDYIDTILDASDKLSNLISNILRLNKLENQEIQYPTEEYDLCRQLADCVLRLESLWDEKNIQLYADIEDKAIIKNDSDMLEIVWNNLLSNALKYTEAGGTVWLVQTSDENTVTVSVSDTGCGMDNETMKRVFDKFYQADNSRSGEGNGLGLTLAYRIVEKLGGTLSVTSELGKGSTFTVIIPVNY